jgi:hypothetical protein
MTINKNQAVNNKILKWIKIVIMLNQAVKIIINTVQYYKRLLWANVHYFLNRIHLSHKKYNNKICEQWDCKKCKSIISLKQKEIH